MRLVTSTLTTSSTAPRTMLEERSEIAKRRLAGLRAQREAQRLSAEELADRTRRAVIDAQAADVPVAEIARQLGIDRSTLYRVYLEAEAA